MIGKYKTEVIFAMFLHKMSFIMKMSVFQTEKLEW